VVPAAGGLLVAALILVACLVPLPFTVMVPGSTADTLGKVGKRPVIEITGHPVRTTSGQLRLVTIGATLPNARITGVDAMRAWFDDQEAVVPRDSVYQSGKSDKELDRINTAQMKGSQDAATAAALRYLKLSGEGVSVKLNLPDVGGPSAGLLFTLGIVDKLDGDGHGGDLTRGRVIAGTGTIRPDGAVGAVGGVTLKTQAAWRDGARVFLVPKGECGDAKATAPRGLKLGGGYYSLAGGGCGAYRGGCA